MYVSTPNNKILEALKNLVDGLTDYSIDSDIEFNTAYDAILFTDGIGVQANSGSNESISYKEFKTLYGTE